MAFIGTPLDTRNTFQSLVGKRFSGDGSETDFTLDVTPGSTLDLEVFVGNVRQDPNSAYTVSGTTLSFTGAPPSGTNNIYVVHQAKSVGTIDVPALGVSTASIQADAINGTKIADDSISDEHLDITAITGQTAITSLADTDKFLVSDASDSGNLKYVEKQYLPSGGFVRLNGTTGTGLSNITHDNIFTSTYEVYKIIGSHSMGSNNAETRMVVRIGGSDYEDNYRYSAGAFERTSSSGSSSVKSAWDNSVISLTTGSSYTASHPTAMELTVYNPKDGTRNTCIQWRVSYYRPNEDTWYALTTGGIWVDGGDGQNNDGFKIYPSTGTLDNVKYSIYGLVSS